MTKTHSPKRGVCGACFLARGRGLASSVRSHPAPTAAGGGRSNAFQTVPQGPPTVCLRFFAVLAFVIALGTGSAYAANTVFSTDIVDGQVNSADVEEASR